MNKDAVAEMSKPYHIEAAQKQVPEGYKQTEVGVIPESWAIAKLGERASFIGSGKTNTKQSGNYPLYGSTGLIGSCPNPEYDGEAILVARVGANAGKLNFVNGKYGVSDNTIITRLKSDSNIHYFKYWLVRKNLNTLVFGSGQPLITGTQLKELLLPVPEMSEQIAIANALSDTDALLSELEKLIAKKQAIKTATMQQLLTGRTRLPQFAHHPDGSKKGYKQSELGEIPEDWEIAPLGKLANIKTGSKNNQDKVADGVYPFFVRSETIERLNSYSYDCEAILVPGEGGIGSIFHYIHGKFDAHQRVYVIRQFDNCIGKFIYFQMRQRFGAHAMENSVKATVDSLRLPTFQEFSVFLPSTEEQTAIATVLSDMDEAIQALEQRLNKTRQIKQGMMQELLTGKTRLVASQSR